jgi:hypothetical protein
MLLSDGASRFEDLFELATWEELQALLGENNPDELLRQVRAAEAADTQPLGGTQLRRQHRHRLTTPVQIAGALSLAAGVPRPHPLDPRTNRSTHGLAGTPRTGKDVDR